MKISPLILYKKLYTMTENSKINVTLHIENLNLQQLENLAEDWVEQPIPKLDLKCSWCETPEQFLKRKKFILPLLISKKLDFYEKEYPLSDI